MLILFGFLVKGESEGDELAFARYTGCVARLEKAAEALKCVFLQCATLGFGEEADDVGRGGNGKELVALCEGYRVASFQSTVSTVHVARASTAVHPFTAELP